MKSKLFSSYLDSMVVQWFDQSHSKKVADLIRQPSQRGNTALPTEPLRCNIKLFHHILIVFDVPVLRDRVDGAGDAILLPKPDKLDILV